MIYRWLALAFFLTAGIDGFGQLKDYPFARLTDQDGLSDNNVRVVYKDRQGFLWIGTTTGLNRYDGYGFKVFRHSDLDTFSVSDEDVKNIFEGPDGRLFINTSAGDANIFDPRTGAFLPRNTTYFKDLKIPWFGLVNIVHDAAGRFYFIFADSGVYRLDPGVSIAKHLQINGTGRSAAPIAAATLDSTGSLWLSHLDGMFERIDLGRQTVILSSNILRKKGLKPSNSYHIFIDNRNKAWLFAEDNRTGLWEFDPQTGVVNHFCQDSGVARLNSNNVVDIVQDEHGLFWIATNQGGVNILDLDKHTVRYLLHSEDQRSLAENIVNSLCRDDVGGIWVGTMKSGICHYQSNMLRFPLYKSLPGDPNSLPYDDINCFAEDARGNIWMGTDGGGLVYFDRTANRFTQFRHKSDDPKSLSVDVITALLVDHAGRVWVGTYRGGLDFYDGRGFIHFKHNPADPSSLADDRVFALKEGAPGEIWIGTLDGGLDRFEVATHQFYHNTAYAPNSILSNYVASLAEDSAKNFWVGTAYGISVLSANTGRYSYYFAQTSKLADNVILDMICDHAGNVWVATRRGLCVMQPGRDTFQVFHMRDGLPSNVTLNVLEDDDGYLWVSSGLGLSRVAVSPDGTRLKIACLNFDERDGLQAKAFSRGAALRTRKGELIFGGAKGFNLFWPESIRLDEHIPPVVLTGVQLYDKEMALPASFAQDGELVFDHDQNNFTLEFAALSFINARKNKYVYQLVGFDKDWMVTDGRNHRATYTNIDPGHYTFRVKASNSDGIWNDKGITIRIIIRPPFWKTTTAYIIYVVLALVILYLARTQIIRRARARFALEEERRETRRVRDMDRMKIKFFTNLSHEFRTPLSLILSPIDKLIRSEHEPAKRQLAMTVERNARRLLHLVNQLLDLRKMEVNELKLNMNRGDVAAFIRSASDSFADLAAERGITYKYEAEIEHLPAVFDKDKVERIIFNLLSNALKFTSKGGSVTVELKIVERDAQDALLELRVSDTGIGIPTALQEKIFESFFQGGMPASGQSHGTGIGLAITREFVEMHGGTIKVDSVPDQGSSFTILLPVSLLPGTSEEEMQAAPEERDAPLSGNEAEPGFSRPSNGSPGIGAKRFKVLLVEDDEDFRFYLKENLAPQFSVIEAGNGRDGWQKALSAAPDLIVSDVNMPVMDGLELAKKMRNDVRVSHIPLILLTALSDEEDQLRALETGANDYISKPFNVEILISRMRNLIEFRKSGEEHFKRRDAAEPAEIEEEPESTDEDFVRDAVAVLEKHIANAEFSVDDWSREMGLSRTTMYKRVVATTGKTPTGFIRNFRMKRAAQLLEKTKHNVAEVAYMVGFNNPKYFARYFREVFGVLPSVYQAEVRKKK